MILYRPVGLQELELIYDSGMKSFPARLPQQPIFYPVLQLEYARQIASDWNVKNGQFAGYVTQFKVEDEYISRFEEHTVGGSQYQEYWIPAEEVEEFNRHIVGHIKVVEAHFGDTFQGFVPEKFALKGKNAVEQFTLLTNSYLYKRMDFFLEIKRNHKAVFLNYPFWQTYEFKNPGLKEKIVQAIKEAWLTSFPKIPLPLPPPLQKDIQLTKQTESYVQHSADTAQEETAPEEQTDSNPFVKSVREDISPVRQTYSHSPVNTVFEEITSVEDSDEFSFEDPDEEDLTSEEETDSDLLVNPVPKEITPPKQFDSHAQPFVTLVPQEIRPVKQTNAQAHRVTNPVYENSPAPRQIVSHFVRGIELGLSGDYRQAIGELSRAVEKDPNHVIARTSLGVAFHRLGEEDRALACYETALKIDSKSAEAHYFRANILYQQGKVREAIVEYTTAIGLKPELIEAHQKPAPQDRLADYNPTPAEMHRIAKPAYRILDLTKSLEANPRQASLFKQRAAEYSKLGNHEQTITDYNSALTLQPDDADVLHSRGVVYEQIGQHEQARKDYQRAMALNPLLAQEYIHRGVTFGQMGNLRQSIASLTEGIRLAPENPDAYFNRGTAYFHEGDLTRALDDFSSVIRLSAQDEAAYYWRGICNEQAGRREEAIVDYRQFLAISRDPGAKEEIEQRLSQWDAGPRPTTNSPRQDDRQSTDQADSQKQEQHIDLYDLLTALDDRALRSTWLGSGVDCYGEGADELLSFTTRDRPIEGGDFMRITSRIQQTMQGDFIAFNPGSSSHWILIRAWNGNGFYIELNDPVSKRRLRAHFPYLEEVEGASLSYEGLFIPI